MAFKIQKILLVLFVFFISVSAFAADYPLLVKDEIGNSLVLESKPKRIVSCMPAITEMLFAVGAGDKVVGVTTHCDFPKQAKKMPKVGRQIMNLEKIISLEPDLIIMSASAQETDIAKLKKFNLPVYVIDPKSISGTLSSMRRIGHITGEEQKTQRIVNGLEKRLNAVADRVEHPKTVLVIISLKPLMVVGSSNFINDAVKVAGGINLAGQVLAPYPIYSLEELVTSSPEAIIIPKRVVLNKKQIYNDKRWHSLSAVKQGRILFIEDDIISRPGPRIVDAIEKINSFLFKEVEK